MTKEELETFDFDDAIARIVRLEQENARLTTNEKSLLAERKIIVKENAELKHQLNKNPCVCNTEWHCNDCLEQLTKAIGIIKRWYETNSSACIEPSQELIEVTEQFLSEVKE